MKKQVTMEMEKTISSMLDMVLKEESDEETSENTNTNKKNNISYVSSSNENWNKKFSCESNINEKLQDNSNSKTESNYILSYHGKKNNEIKINLNYNFEAYIPKNYRSSNSNIAFSNSITTNKRNIEENINLFSLNELEEILEKKVKANEEIDMEAYRIFQGKFKNLITSQNGSRILQRALKKTNGDIISKMFSEVRDQISSLMVDNYANYFCQKFFNFLNETDRICFLTNIKESLGDISKNKIGTYPLQSIIDYLRTDNEKEIVIEGFRGKVLILCLDPHGTHVIEKMIVVFEEERIDHIYEDIINNLIMLANNSNGLCVVKKVIIHGQTIDTLNSIKDRLVDNALSIVKNAYGNYALQVALENWSSEFCFPICKRFVGSFYELSLHKHSSNVIEKSFEKCHQFILSKFVEEICQDSKIFDLMKSSYGNYVVQKALYFSSGNEKNTLVTYIKKHIEKLTDKKLINKWKTIVNSSIYLEHIDFNQSVPQNSQRNNFPIMNINSMPNFYPLPNNQMIMPNLSKPYFYPNHPNNSYS